MEITVKINGKDFTFQNYEFLKNFVRSLPDEEQFADLFYELAQSKSSEIRTFVADNDKINKETALLLLRDKNINILRDLPGNERVREIATMEDIQRLINTNDSDLLCNLASNAEDFNSSICELIAKELVKCEDTEVRYRLAGNRDIPVNILHELAKDEDESVAHKAKDSCLRILNSRN